ncbi:MAG: hypothetical protein AAF787_00485 [Chloroflexota bacterium]
MTAKQGSCPLTQQELVDEYFMEYRAALVAVAAFLDRMDRSIDKNAEHDFRVIALRESLVELTSAEPERVERIQMILSDRDTTLMDERDSQSAYGAFNPESRKPAIEEA